MAADYIIVGAGSAGCALAGRLSEDPDVDVLLLEAGGPDTAAEIRVPAAFPIMFKSATLDWDLLGEPEPGLGGRRLYLPRGRVIGGSSSINAMIYLRGNRLDYDDWAAGGCTGWSYAEVLPYFKRGEDNERGENAYHGAGGPLHVSERQVDAPSGRRDARGSGRGGVRAQPGPERRAAGRGRPLPAHSAGRQALERGGRLPAPCVRTARTSRCATRASSSGSSSRATAPWAWSWCGAARARSVRAEREVILSAGAYHSPALLLLSGIGPAEELAPFGIPVREELPVGRNLQDHCMVNLNYATDEAGPLRDLHPGELRAARAGGPRPAHLELPRGRRLLPHPARSARAGRRVPLRRGAAHGRGPGAAAGQRRRVRPRGGEALVARHGLAAGPAGRLEAARRSRTSSRPRTTRAASWRESGSRSRSHDNPR